MGLLDPLVKGVVRLIERGGQPFGDKLFDLDEEKFQEAIKSEDTKADSLVTRFLGDVVESVETDLTQEFRTDDGLKPDGIEDRINAAETDAVSYALANITASLGIELAGLTQLESHQFGLSQITSFLALEDIVGRELAMYTEKGVNPALEAKVAKETRSEFVSLQDAVEFALRKKPADSGYLRAGGAADAAVDKIGSNEPVNPNNLLEEWGIRDDQLEILEEVSIGALEPEELIEEPVQFGVIPPRDVVQDELDRSGIAEGTKELYMEVVDAMPRSADLWEQRTTTEALIGEIDTLVDDGQLTPAQARLQLPDEADEAADALEDRWMGLDDLPNKAPTRSQLETWFGWGLINRNSLVAGLRNVDVDPEEYPAVVGENILDEIDGDLRTALGVGLIDENYYSRLARTVGLDQDVIRQLLGGKDLDDIGKERASEEIPLAERPTTAVIDIGTSRSAALAGAGIDNIGDLAAADVGTVADAAALTETAAETLISRAQQMTS
jgi:hypothetical protein